MSDRDPRSWGEISEEDAERVFGGRVEADDSELARLSLLLHEIDVEYVNPAPPELARKHVADAVAVSRGIYTRHEPAQIRRRPTLDKRPRYGAARRARRTSLAVAVKVSLLVTTATAAAAGLSGIDALTGALNRALTGVIDQVAPGSDGGDPAAGRASDDDAGSDVPTGATRASPSWRSRSGIGDSRPDESMRAGAGHGSEERHGDDVEVVLPQGSQGSTGINSVTSNHKRPDASRANGNRRGNAHGSAKEPSNGQTRGHANAQGKGESREDAEGQANNSVRSNASRNARLRGPVPTKTGHPVAP